MIEQNGKFETGNVRANGDVISKVTTKVRAEIEYAVRVPPPVDDTPQPEDIPLNIMFESFIVQTAYPELAALCALESFTA